MVLGWFTGLFGSDGADGQENLTPSRDSQAEHNNFNTANSLDDTVGRLGAPHSISRAPSTHVETTHNTDQNMMDADPQSDHESWLDSPDSQPVLPRGYGFPNGYPESSDSSVSPPPSHERHVHFTRGTAPQENPRNIPANSLRNRRRGPNKKLRRNVQDLRPQIVQSDEDRNLDRTNIRNPGGYGGAGDIFQDELRNDAWYGINEALGAVALQEAIVKFLSTYCLQELMAFIAHTINEAPYRTTHRFVRRYMDDEPFYMNANADFNDLDSQSRAVRVQRLAAMMRDEIHLDGQELGPIATHFEEEVIDYIRSYKATLQDGFDKITTFIHQFGFYMTVKALNQVEITAHWFLKDIQIHQLDGEIVWHHTTLDDNETAGRIWEFIKNPNEPVTERERKERALPKHSTRVCIEDIRPRYEHRAIIHEQMFEHMDALAQALRDCSSSVKLILDAVQSQTYNWILLYALILRHFLVFGQVTLTEELRRHSEQGKEAMISVERFENTVKATMEPHSTHQEYELELDTQYLVVGRRNHGRKSNRFMNARAAWFTDCIIAATRGALRSNYITCPGDSPVPRTPPRLGPIPGAFPDTPASQRADRLAKHNSKLRLRIKDLERDLKLSIRSEEDSRNAKKAYAEAFEQARSQFEEEMAAHDRAVRDQVEMDFRAEMSARDLQLEQLQQDFLQAKASMQDLQAELFRSGQQRQIVDGQFDATRLSLRESEQQRMQLEGRCDDLASSLEEAVQELEVRKERDRDVAAALQEGQEALRWKAAYDIEVHAVSDEFQQNINRLALTLYEERQFSSSLEDENAQLQTTIQGLEAELAREGSDGSEEGDGSDDAAGLADLERRLADCEEHGKKLSGENAELIKTNQLLQTQRTSRAGDGVQEEVDRLRAEIESLREDVANANDDAGEAEDEAIAHSGDNVLLRAEVEELTEQIADHLAKLAELETENQGLKRQRHGFEQALANKTDTTVEQEATIPAENVEQNMPSVAEILAQYRERPPPGATGIPDTSSIPNLDPNESGIPPGTDWRSLEFLARAKSFMIKTWFREALQMIEQKDSHIEEHLSKIAELDGRVIELGLEIGESYEEKDRLQTKIDDLRKRQKASQEALRLRQIDLHHLNAQIQSLETYIEMNGGPSRAATNLPRPWRAPGQAPGEPAPAGTRRRPSRDFGVPSAYPLTAVDIGHWEFRDGEDPPVSDQAQIMLRNSHLVPHTDEITPEDLRRAQVDANTEYIIDGLVWFSHNDPVPVFYPESSLPPSSSESSHSSSSKSSHSSNLGSSSERSPPHRSSSDRDSSSHSDPPIPTNQSPLPESPRFPSAPLSHSSDAPSSNTGSSPLREKVERLEGRGSATAVARPGKRRRRPSVDEFFPANDDEEEVKECDEEGSPATKATSRRRKKRKMSRQEYKPTTPTKDDSEDDQLPKTPKAPRKHKKPRPGKTTPGGSKRKRPVEDVEPIPMVSSPKPPPSTGSEADLTELVASTPPRMVTRSMDGTRKKRRLSE